MSATLITPVSQMIHTLPVTKLSPHPPPGQHKGQAPSAHFRRVQPIVVYTRGRWSFGPFLHTATRVKECLDTPWMASREKVTICCPKVSRVKSMVLAVLLTVSIRWRGHDTWLHLIVLKHEWCTIVLKTVTWMTPQTFMTRSIASIFNEKYLPFFCFLSNYLLQKRKCPILAENYSSLALVRDSSRPPDSL